MRDDATGLDHIPGDNGPPIINRTFSLLRDPWGFDNGMKTRFGPIFRTRILGRTAVSVASPELIGEALLDRSRNLSSKQGWAHTIGELFSGGLMLRDFDDHQRHRKLMQFAFRGQARRGYHARLERRVAKQLESWTPNQPFEFYPRLKQALLEQAAEVFLGIEHDETITELLGCFMALVKASTAVVKLPIPGSNWRRGLLARRKLEVFFMAEIPARRAGSGSDLFSVLCRSEDEQGERLSDTEIVDHMIFLLFASHDTTATGLSTLVDELTRAPQLQDRAAHECESVATQCTDGILPFEQLGELEYTERCFSEALRLNPPVPYLARRTVSACPIGGHELPARTPVMIHVRTVQHDPQVWADPLRFDPERFGPAQKEACKHPHAWVPFGGGAHRCIGADLARQQVSVFMFHLLTRYRVERVKTEATTWRRLPLPTPADGLPIRLLPRHAGLG